MAAEYSRHSLQPPPPLPPLPKVREMMAKQVDDAEFWLPSDFLEDNYLASITAQFANNTIEEEAPPQVMSTSPQSTLRSWSFSSSPESPSTPFAKPRSDALETLYQAARQVVRLGLDGKRRATVHDKEALIQQQLRAAHFYQLKKQQLMKQQYAEAAAAAASAWGRQIRSREHEAWPQNLSSSAWPPLQKQHHQQHRHRNHQQQHNGSGMRAVFLNGASSRRESAGTGVFLPRRVGTPNEPRKKPSCSTVLLPARVVQALNLNLSEMGVHPRLPSGYVLENDVMMAASLGKRSNHYHPQQAPAGHGIRLPPEWTY